MFYDHIITEDPYGVENAVKPWDSEDAEREVIKRKMPVPTDPPEQMDRCLSCPFEKPTMCDGYQKCWYRLGKQPPPVKEEPKKVLPRLPKKKDEPQPPKGYDREKLDAAMVHNYTDQEIADALGLSLYMARKWMKWRYQE